MPYIFHAYLGHSLYLKSFIKQRVGNNCLLVAKSTPERKLIMWKRLVALAQVWLAYYLETCIKGQLRGKIVLK